MLSVLLASTFVLLPSLQKPVDVYFDGKLQTIRFPPVIQNGRALINVREMFDKLGCVVKHWDSGGKIEAWRAEDHIQIEIGKPTATVNGKKVKLDQPPLLHPYSGGKAMIVPLRFLSESLKATVEYKKAEGRIDVDTTTMNFFNETPPFKVGDKVLYLTAGAYVLATVISVRDWPTSEDVYGIEYKDKSGRTLKPTVGRRYIKKA